MNILICRLKQRVAVPFLSFENVEFSEENQTKILDTLNKIAETNPNYSLNVLKKIIQKIENGSDIEINEEMYECLMEWMNSKPLQPTDLDIIEYTLKDDCNIKIRESPNIISGLGTTGLRTWEAAMYLSNYFIEDPDILNVDEGELGDILELGCGTGMVSISLIKNQQIFERGRKIYITDGDSQLVERIGNNLQLNGIDNKDIKVQKLWWGEDDVPESVKTVVAADVTYDSSTIPDLIQVLNEGMSQCNVETAIIAATERNNETLKVWEEYLDMGSSDCIWTWTVSTVVVGESSDQKLYYGRAIQRIRVYVLKTAKGK